MIIKSANNPSACSEIMYSDIELEMQSHRLRLMIFESWFLGSEYELETTTEKLAGQT
jgi:hypothetical protein